ncbi:FAD-dependent monooxygenase [Achromobacter sp. SD115]|uniref:FAD-dependent monooxygenase n=1 Tax=Achromobacter sp. SD115 TaxID=2782011 RepID=UPI001A977D58|nr:FAD-dependent monooxygenase [Achromobacter sp. SD115]MBO1012455.1 FAD-dependent monooxygenase [Achromobacter sp. SD115]
MKEIEIPVLVVGAGPAGLAATALLAKYGIQTLAITRYPGTANSPRAHITNQRTIEVMRDLGIEDRVRAQATPNALMLNNVWATSFAGKELARLQTWGGGDQRRDDYDRASPCAMCNIPQHLLEPIILTAAREHGAQFLFNTELKTISQDADGVVAEMVDTISGEEIRVRAQYAVGADGGNSLVAKQLGFEFDGEMGLGAAISCWLDVDLTPYVQHRPGVLYWMAEPGNSYWFGSGTFVCVRPWNEWIMLSMYDKSKGEPDLSEDAIVARARAVIGVPDIPVKVKSANKWQINHIAARAMGKGRVFLAGDAAHRHPPANGLGTNTSIQDGFNLAWKLALVLKGQAGPDLLETYSQERQPVARGVVDRAMKSVNDMKAIADAIGFTPGQSAQEGWANLDELFSDSGRGRERRAQLDAAVALQNYQFNCHGVELGQMYVSSAIVPDGSARRPPERDSELYHQATTFPGASLPHAWVEQGRRRISTLDLAGHGRFALLVGRTDQTWRAAAAQAASVFGIDIAVYSIGAGCEVLDIYGDWARLREVSESGCLLVRPDRHVAWRKHAAPDEHGAAAELLDALQGILGRRARAGLGARAVAEAALS